MRYLLQLGLLFSCLFTGVSLVNAAPPVLAEPVAVGQVLAVVGEVQITRSDKKMHASRKTELFAGDLIQTSAEARAQLRFVDGTLTTLGGDTFLRIAVFQPAKKKVAGQAEFELVQGAFRTITGSLLKQKGSQFTVKTNLGVIGIRGTDFWGGYLNPGVIDVLLIDGEHAVDITNKSGTVHLAKAGQGTTLSPEQTALVVKEWPQAKVDRAVATIAWPNGAPPVE